MSSQNVIEVENVVFRYSQYKVLDNVSLNIQAGDMVSIIGPNGGGKTTLLKLILGLLEPESGTVKVYGESPRGNMGYLGYVPQYSRFDEQFPITVFEVVLTGRLEKRMGFYSKHDRRAAAEALEKVGLADFADRSFQELSGGQRQRVLIARALAGRPSILLLDEPTSNVDAAVGTMLHELLEELNKTHTILLVTHDVGFVDDITNRVFCVNNIVHEHPADKLDASLISAAYGNQMRMVRHDINLED
ncbi:MAG: metal ABC transporter ATP-binding protein [Spirochaetota bacterium]